MDPLALETNARYGLLIAGLSLRICSLLLDFGKEHYHLNVHLKD